MKKSYFFIFLFFYLTSYASDVENYLKVVNENKTSYSRMVQENQKLYLKAIEENMKIYYGMIGKVWGKKNVILSNKKNITYYSKDLRERENIDYDKGKITIEIISSKKPKPQYFSNKIKQLKNSKLSKNTDKELIYKNIKTNIPKQYDNINKNIIVSKKITTKDIEVKKLLNGKTIYFVEKPLVLNYKEKLATKYLPIIRKYSKLFGIDTSYILAIIDQESSFNLKAISYRYRGTKRYPLAFGMMQIVPTTGGKDAYFALTGKNTIPPKDYLLNPEKNIALGALYIRILQKNYLAGVNSKDKLYLCTTSAYNGGIGTLYKNLIKNRNMSRAINKINRLNYKVLYKKLISYPFPRETRNYVRKIKVKILFWERVFLKKIKQHMKS